MKRILAIIVSIVILFQGFSNLCIMASFYFQQDYIAENLCINRFDAIPVCKGQCYLTKQLKENKSKNQKILGLKYKNLQLFFQSTTNFFQIKAILSIVSLVKGFDAVFFSQQYFYKIFHPPKVCLVAKVIL